MPQCLTVMHSTETKKRKDQAGQRLAAAEKQARDTADRHGRDSSHHHEAQAALDAARRDHEHVSRERTSVLAALFFVRR